MDSSPKMPPGDSPDHRLAVLDDLSHAVLRAAISRVAAVIGHLIGTPLNVITGRAALIRANPSAEGSAENARRIEEQVERLAQRIQRLIDYLTLPEPGMETRSADVVVREALALYAPIAEERGTSIKLATETLPNTLVEGTSALVVLTSLLSLAVRAAPRGEEVELSVEATAPNRVVFELRVPGLSVPRVRIDRLDPPEDDNRDEAELLQILSVCFAIARRQGGRVDVVSGDDGKSSIRFECVTP